MRIALTIGNYDSNGGGAERWTDRHARQLIARGHEVHIVARAALGLPPAAKFHAVEIARALRRQPRLAFADRAERVVDSIGVDVVHDMGDGWHCDLFMPHHGTRIGGFARNSQLVPKAVRWARALAWRTLPRYREFVELEARQFSARPGKRFIALSQMVAGHMRSHYGVAESDIRIVPNGVDTNWFTPAPTKQARSLIRRKLGFDSAVIFLIVAHNFRLKGVDEVLAAAARVQSELPIAVVVAGDGPIDKYRRLANNLGIRPFVRFVGSWPDPRPLYRAADAYLQPSYYDPCSLVALEALACGLPVVTTRHNGAGELMTDGIHGYLIDEPQDVASLTDCMSRLLDGELRSTMSTAARHLACQWTQARNTASIESLYCERRGHRQAA